MTSTPCAFTSARWWPQQANPPSDDLCVLKLAKLAPGSSLTRASLLRLALITWILELPLGDPLRHAQTWRDIASHPSLHGEDLHQTVRMSYYARFVHGFDLLDQAVLMLETSLTDAQISLLLSMLGLWRDSREGCSPESNHRARQYEEVFRRLSAGYRVTEEQGEDTYSQEEGEDLANCGSVKHFLTLSDGCHPCALLTSARPLPRLQRTFSTLPFTFPTHSLVMASHHLVSMVNVRASERGYVPRGGRGLDRDRYLDSLHCTGAAPAFNWRTAVSTIKEATTSWSTTGVMDFMRAAARKIEVVYHRTISSAWYMEPPQWSRFPLDTDLLALVLATPYYTATKDLQPLQAPVAASGGYNPKSSLGNLIRCLEALGLLSGADLAPEVLEELWMTQGGARRLYRTMISQAEPYMDVHVGEVADILCAPAYQDLAHVPGRADIMQLAACGRSLLELARRMKQVSMLTWSMLKFEKLPGIGHITLEVHWADNKNQDSTQLYTRGGIYDEAAVFDLIRLAHYFNLLSHSDLPLGGLAALPPLLRQRGNETGE
eukprot:jgi/Chlat1/2926/Chrsp2S04638